MLKEAEDRERADELRFEQELQRQKEEMIRDQAEAEKQQKFNQSQPAEEVKIEKSV